MPTIRFKLRVHIDDPREGRQRRFTKEVNADVPQVPRIGEAIVVPVGDGSAENLGAHRITDVIYDLHGRVFLDFQRDGLSLDPEHEIQQFRRAGFREISEPKIAD